MLHQGLLQEQRGARHLDARPYGADEIAVDARHVGQDLLVEQIEMLLLAADLSDPLPQHVEDVLALGQLALQRDQAHHVAGQLGVLLAAVGAQLLHQGAVTVADGEVAAEHFQRLLGIGHQHALQALAQGGLVTVAVTGHFLHQIGRLADAGESHSSVLEFVAHVCCLLLRIQTGWLKRCSMMPPPRQTSPS
ncbi:hypothetical protein D3C79_649920 [compost metagenome]